VNGNWQLVAACAAAPPRRCGKRQTAGGRAGEADGKKARPSFPQRITEIVNKTKLVSKNQLLKLLSA